MQVKDIPRTISGKIVEIAVRQIVHNQSVNNLQSLANPEALNYFKNIKGITESLVTRQCRMQEYAGLISPASVAFLALKVN